MKTVAVLGASYGGIRTAQILASELPQDWRVVLIDRNSHFNHLYVLPRFAVVQGHEHKAFIPYQDILRNASPISSSRHLFLHAQVISIDGPNRLTLSRSFPELGLGSEVEFDYMVYALGSHLPAPIDLWGPVGDTQEKGEVVEEYGVEHRGTKVGGIDWLRRFRRRIEHASSVLVVGGGALGIQYATDIAEVFPDKPVTLLHSRKRLLPRFDEEMHDEILAFLSASSNITTILGERLDLDWSSKSTTTNERIVRTSTGREIRAGLVLLCTGQTPNTSLLQSLLPSSIVEAGPSKGMIKVNRYLQIGVPSIPLNSNLSQLPFHEGVMEEEVEQEQEGTEQEELYIPHSHMFAIGDAADAFGAINAGHNAYFQGEIAARNILQLISQSSPPSSPSSSTSSSPSSSPSLSSPFPLPSSISPTLLSSFSEPVVELHRYNPGPPAIKITLGLGKSLFEIGGLVGMKEERKDDQDVGLIWKMFGVEMREDGEGDG